MNRRRFQSIALTGAFVACTGGLAGAQSSERVSTVGDQRSLNLTVYNSGIALVHDRRRLTFQNGVSRIAWRDVSGQIQAESALLASQTHPGGLLVLEQNFNFDLLNPESLLAKYVGQEVTVVHPPSRPGEAPVRERARLLSNNGGVVLQYADRIETSVDGRIIYPSIPGNLRDRPTLTLDVQSATAGQQDVDLSYLTGGLGWRADYVGVVSPHEDRVDLNGFVTLSNTSGTSYRNARLQLVAGNVNVANPPQAYEALGSAAAVYVPPRQMTEQSYFEYHLYTLQRPTTVADNQTKQVSLLSAHNIPLRKTLELRGNPDYYNSQNPDLGDKLSVGVYLTFTNKGGQLGIPLPGGIVRLYKSDRDGTSQFLGSDSIDHTPRNEDVRLHVGDSFDVTARKKQTDFKALGGPVYQSSYEIRLGNAKDKAQDVLVVEPIPGDWAITAESIRHTKSSSSTANWIVHVPANSHVTLTYTARVRYW